MARKPRLSNPCVEWYAWYPKYTDSNLAFWCQGQETDNNHLNNYTGNFQCIVFATVHDNDPVLA